LYGFKKRKKKKKKKKVKRKEKERYFVKVAQQKRMILLNFPFKNIVDRARRQGEADKRWKIEFGIP